MFATVRRYRVMGGSMDDLLHEIDTGFAEMVQDMDGFVGYECIDCGGGTLMTISMFHERDQAEATTTAAADWIRTNLADRYEFERLDAITGEVAVSRARAEMLEPAHR